MPTMRIGYSGERNNLWPVDQHATFRCPIPYSYLGSV